MAKAWEHAGWKQVITAGCFLGLVAALFPDKALYAMSVHNAGWPDFAPPRLLVVCSRAVLAATAIATVAWGCRLRRESP